METVFQALIFPFLFLTLFFEVFAILTFFDKEAARRRALGHKQEFPTVAIVVPCYNEATTIRGTVTSLLQLNYPKDRFSIVLVDDGSTDDTRTIMHEYANHPNISLVFQKNAGKHAALNNGIAQSSSEFIACLDADSFVDPNSLKELIAHFDHEKIGAVTASIAVHEPRRALERAQQAEYALGITLRHILSIFNGLYVTPGPFTAYRRSVFEKVGPFRSAHQTEDMEIALRIQRGGWHIHNAPRALVFTKAPNTVQALVKQRVRWTSGFIRNCIDNKDLFGNPSSGLLGLMILPFNALLIFFGISLFAIGVARIGESLWQWLVRTSEIPLTALWALPSLDWFFAPVSAIVVLLMIATGIAFTAMYVGSRIANTPGSMGPAVLWFAVLYGLIAPLWLVRAAVDVAFDIKRSWR